MSECAEDVTRTCNTCDTVKPPTAFEPHRYKCRSCRGKESYGSLRARGLCTGCGCPATASRSLCSKCLETARNRSQDIRERRRESALCTGCGGSVSSGKRLCCACLASMRVYKLTSRYGISPDRYRLVLASQGGVCAVCHERGDRPQSLFPLDVDHCHKRGFVRGLLCSMCNRSIGMMKDSPAILRSAADYLERSK